MDDLNHIIDSQLDHHRPRGRYDEGNWTDRLELTLPNPDGLFTITLVVAYPPDDWELYPKGEPCL